MNDLFALLSTFADAHGLSGFEDQVSVLLARQLEPLMDEVRTDKLGNVIGTRRGSNSGPAVMVAAHMDEIGLVVKHVEDEGFLRFVPVGGWFDQTLLAQRVIVHTRDGRRLTGVVGSRPPHVMDEEERKKPVKIKDMFIDIGAASATDAQELGVQIGSPVTLDRTLAQLGNDLVTGKSLDDRVGVVMMVAAMQRLRREELRGTVYAVGTVQEEVGLKGAKTSAYGLTPDVGIAADVAVSGDHPGITRSESPTAIGKGPVITILDASGRGVIAPRPVVHWLRSSAEAADIPYQLEVGSSGTTDATSILLTKAGIPCSVVSVAARYIHSPVEVVSLADLDRGADLIAQAVLRAHEHF